MGLSLWASALRADRISSDPSHAHLLPDSTPIRTVASSDLIVPPLAPFQPPTGSLVADSLSTSLPTTLTSSTLGTLSGPLAVAGLLAILAFLASTLRWCLMKFSRDEVLRLQPNQAKRSKMEALLDRAKPLTTAARWFEITFQVSSVCLLVSWSSESQTAFSLGIIVLILIPSWMFLWSVIPRSIALAQSSRILASVLPSFAILAKPIWWLVRYTDWVQTAVFRLLRAEHPESGDGQVLQNLRSALKDRGENDHLDETAQELIRNVLDFRAADAAEVMTPRTEVQAVDVQDGLASAMQTILVSGHSRIPVFGDTIDSIIGTVTARRVMREMAKEPADRANLTDLLDPPILVPETKPVAQLLREFRDVRQKLAVVLDEYGGTAGIVTMSDVVGEIVGDFLEEHDHQTQTIREVDRNLFEVSAGLHVSEVNEALSLEIPEEEDFETLGGFVLARLGHIPQVGESFVFGETQYAVQEASDRRVIWVRVRTSA